MLDPQLLRANPENVKLEMNRHGADLDLALLNSLESRRKDIQVKTQTLQSERNTRSKSIGMAKAKGEDIQPLLDSVSQLGDELKAAEAELNDIQAELLAIQLTLPNILSADVPDGKDEEQNQLVRTWGEPKKYDFEAVSYTHLTLPTICSV